MATYVVGDVQGCFRSLQALVREIAFQPGRDRIVIAGDLVNRGPASLSVLRWAVQQGAAVEAVLGNHDLHLLALAAGCAKLKANDTFDAILQAPDREELLRWLQARPLLVEEGGYVIVHAGLHPDWTLAEARTLARAVAQAVAGPERREFFANMYGNEPARWSRALTGWERLRFATNAFTRMRMLREGDKALDATYKARPADAPPGLRAWFDFPAIEARPPMVFGHWSALGLVSRPDVIALDTGCVWGGALSAVRLEDRAIFQVPAQDGALPLDE